ncbi:MAG: N-acetylneuraminate synthase family protein [Solidesulfovibrio sp.]
MTSLFVAEISSNHNQDLGRCLNFVDAVATVGCGAVKFQFFRIEELFAPEILDKSAKHRARKSFELPETFLSPIAARCHEKGLAFGCTPFSLKGVMVLANHVDFLKIASYELLWSELLVACAKTGLPIMLSTGMADLAEVTEAVAVLREVGCRDLTLLHCASAYPLPPGDANLAAIATLRQTFDCKTGWSDHSRQPGVIHRAVHHFGAEVVEFHLDLEGAGAEYGPGHCWLPSEIATVIRDTATGFSADGNGVKTAGPSELPDRDWRADPADGLRPLRHMRKIFRGDG